MKKQFLKLNFKKRIISFLTIIVLIISGCSSKIDINSGYEEKCIAIGADWNETFKECFTTSSIKEAELKMFCDKYNGKFNSCDSACRHENKDSFCIEVCVLTCKLN
jgi:protein involved in sex pheromone biosynthesis